MKSQALFYLEIKSGFCTLKWLYKQVVGHIVVSLLLSMVPHPMNPLLFGFRTCDWWRRGGFVVIAPVPIHQWTWALYSASHLRRGQFLHLQTLLEEYFFKGFAFLSHLCHIFVSSHTSLCGHFGFGLVPRLRLEKEVSAFDLNFWEEACGLCSFIWSVGFLCCTKKAWEHKSPKPLEKRKVPWKSLQKVRLLQQRQTGR